MRKLIKVTQRHIKDGKRASIVACPVALALNEATGKQFIVARYSIENLSRPSELIEASRSVKRFVEKYDKYGRKAVKPFNFFLEVI